jgi:hypothetical protein
MAHDVFISYSSKDKTVADATCATLEARGIRCWMAPRDIRPSDDWGEAIINAIQGSAAFVLLFSANANASPQIKREVERAVNKGIPVIPLRIENVMPAKSLEYFLSTPHWLDAYSPPMERHLGYLADVLRSVLDNKPAPPPPKPVARGIDRRLLLGGGAIAVVALVAGWFLLDLSSHTFVGKWTAQKIEPDSDAQSPFGAFSISVFLKAAQAGGKLFATSQVDEQGGSRYSWGGDDTGTITVQGGKASFTSDITHQTTEMSYFLVKPSEAGSSIGALGGKAGDSAIAIQNMGGMQSMLVGTSQGQGLVGHWYTDTPANAAIGAVKTALDVSADGHYRYHFQISETGIFQAADGKWTRTRANHMPVTGTYKFDGGSRVTTAGSDGTISWVRAD